MYRCWPRICNHIRKSLKLGLNSDKTIKVTALLAVGLFAARLIHLTMAFHVEIPWMDDWPIFHKIDQSATGFFVQHGPHKMGLGGIILKVLNPLFDFNQTWHVFLIIAVMMANSVLALQLKWKNFGKPSYFDIVIPIIYLSWSSYGTLLFTPNIALNHLPVFLFLLYLLVHRSAASNTTRAPLKGLLGFCLVFTGFGVVGAGVLLLFETYQSLRTKKIENTIPAGVIFLSFVLFFSEYKSAPIDENVARPEFLDLIKFNLAYYANALSAQARKLSFVTAGLLLALLLSINALTLKGKAPKEQKEFLLLLIGFSVLFGLASSMGRSGTNYLIGYSSRYYPYTMPLLFATYLGLSIHKIKGQYFLISCLLFILSYKEFKLADTSQRIIEKVHESKVCFEKSLQSGQVDHGIATCGKFVFPVSKTEELKDHIQYIENKYHPYWKNIDHE